MGIRHAFIPVAAVIMTACAAPYDAAAQNETPARTVTVTGEGEATAAPDMAVLSIGVSTDAPTAAAALRQNSADMAATIKKLKDLGVADRDIQTSGLSVNPRYDYSKDGSPPKVVGFNASNMLTVKLRNLDKAGAVIDQAVQSGANSLNGIQFGFTDPKPLMDTARKDAVANARAKAELYADAAGVKLGRVLTIQDGYVSSPSPQPVMRLAAAKEASVPLESGESLVSASVTIVYEIN